MPQALVHPAVSAPMLAMEADTFYESSGPHTISVIDLGWNHPSGWRYHGLFGPQLDGWIGLARSHNLRSWEKLARPVMAGNRLRWPSVMRRGSAAHMFVGDDIDGLRGIARYEASIDDLTTWGGRQTVVPGISDGGGQGNPFIFRDPASGDYTLWYFRRPLPDPGTYQLRYRRARFLEELAEAEDVLALEAEHVLAAPAMIYYNLSYWLYTEEMDGGKESTPWRTRVRRAPSPVGPFGPPEPISEEDEGCPFPHVFGDKIYLFTCRRRKPTWDIVLREIPPGEGKL